MKVLICLILLCITCAVYGMDFYGYFYDEYDVGKEEEIEGTVANVFPHGQVWAVIVYTSRPLNGYFTASAVILLYNVRPKVCDGDTLRGVYLFNGNWETQQGYCPTFRRKE